MEKKTDRAVYRIDVDNLPPKAAFARYRRIMDRYLKESPTFKEVLEREDPPLKENS